MMRGWLVLLVALAFSPGCKVTAKVDVTGEAPSGDGKNIDKGQPAKIVGTVENRGDKNVLLDSKDFVWEPGKDQKFDFEVKKGTTVVAELRYPNGPKARQTRDVPTDPAGDWPCIISIPAVDLVDSQEASVQFFTDLAESLTLKEAKEASSPPSTTYDQVAKLVGALVIVPQNWSPKDGVIGSYQSAVRVLKADPPPTSGVGFKRKRNVLDNAAVSASLSVPVYGSLGAKMALNNVYRMNFDLTHTAILNVDRDIFRTLLDPKDPGANAAMHELEFWAKASPNSRVLVLRSMRYIVAGTIGLIEGKSFTSSVDVAVASAFTANAAYSFSVDDEEYVSFTGAVTSWLWVEPQELPLEKLVDLLQKERKNPPGPGIETFIKSGGLNLKPVLVDKAR